MKRFVVSLLAVALGFLGVRHRRRAVRTRGLRGMTGRPGAGLHRAGDVCGPVGIVRFDQTCT